MSTKETAAEFHAELFQEIVTTSIAEQIFKEEAMFDIYTDYLIDAGEFDDAVYSHYQPSGGGVRIDGYCGDPLDDVVARASNSGTLGVIIVDFCADQAPKTITKTEIDAIFKRLTNFVEKARDRSFRSGLEESAHGYELAELINERWDVIGKVKAFLLTNRVLSDKAKGKANSSISGREVSYNVWDVTRLERLANSGREREPLIVNFQELPNGPLGALRASSAQGSQVYLAAIPGLDLATIYDKWGTRLLEQNVRVFLQAKSKVNKGIRGTLENSPELFFSFNNGLTATAEDVETLETPEGTKISKLVNLQIVNGGQTTASVYAAFKNKVDLSKVFVQMKLSVVSPEKANELVPLISRSANSQNKVSDADFFSNHPFHVKIEGFSRRIYAPAKNGSYVETKWYYERARGQYRDAQAYLTSSQKRKFLEANPKAQSFTKTDLAKYQMVWTDKAYFVNRGAQKNFAEFAKMITEEWERNELQFNERYFRCLVAKKIIFGAAERAVVGREWYETGGYRAQHVALAIAFLARSVSKMGKVVDFEAIWNEQAVSEPFERALGQAADCAHEVLMNPQAGYRNISEWAKQEKCLAELSKKRCDWDEQWLASLIDKNEEKEAKIAANKEQSELNGIEAQELVISAGAEFWNDVLRWVTVNHGATEREQGILRTAARMTPTSIPSDKQCLVLVDLMERLKKEGCPHKLRKGARRSARRTRR